MNTGASLDFKISPAWENIECAVLGAILEQPALIAPAVAQVPEMTGFETRRIYNVMCNMHSRDLAVNQDTLTAELQRMYPEHTKPLTAMLFECDVATRAQDGVGRFDELLIYLSEDSHLERIAQACYQWSSLARGKQYSPAGVLDSIEQSVHQMRELVYVDESGITTFEAAAAVAVDELAARYSEGFNVVTTGVQWLDQLTDGWQPGDLWVWAARPNVGKTRVMLGLLMASVLAGNRVGFISLDMARPRLMRYAISSAMSLTGKDVSRLFEPVTWTGDGEVVMRNEILQLDLGGRLLLATDPQRSTRAIGEYVRQMAKAGCQVVMVDQAQNALDFVPDDRGKISMFLSEMKALPRRYDTAMVLFHQINRAGADRPRLENLKESGNFEEFSDFVVLLHDAQRAVLDTAGAWVEDHGVIRAPITTGKNKDDLMDINHDVTPRRRLELNLAKSRSSATRRAEIWFDYVKGAMK